MIIIRKQGFLPFARDDTVNEPTHDFWKRRGKPVFDFLHILGVQNDVRRVEE